MRRRVLAIVLVAAGCVEKGGDVVGTGVVAAGLEADRVGVAWLHLDPSLFVEVVDLHGAIAIEDGVFSIDALIAAQAGFSPPRVVCPLEATPGPEQDLGEDPIDLLDPGPFAIGAIVATSGDAVPPEAAPFEELEDYATATTSEFALLWAAEPVDRDSLWGRRIEASLAAGFQLASVRPCRLGLDCQTQCLDPVDRGAFVLLGRL